MQKRRVFFWTLTGSETLGRSCLFFLPLHMFSPVTVIYFSSLETLNITDLDGLDFPLPFKIWVEPVVGSYVILPLFIFIQVTCGLVVFFFCFSLVIMYP